MPRYEDVFRRRERLMAVTRRAHQAEVAALADVLAAARPTAQCDRPQAYDAGGPRGPVVVEHRPCGMCQGCARAEKFATLDKLVEGEASDAG